MAELVKKQQKKRPLKPEKFTFEATPAQPMRGLRDAETAKNCPWFCEHFMACVMSSADWKLKSRNKRLSEHVTVSLEAFAVLMHCNAFPVWNQRWRVDAVNTDGTTSASAAEASDDDDVSALRGQKT